MEPPKPLTVQEFLLLSTWHGDRRGHYGQMEHPLKHKPVFIRTIIREMVLETRVQFKFNKADRVGGTQEWGEMRLRPEDGFVSAPWRDPHGLHPIGALVEFTLPGSRELLQRLGSYIYEKTSKHEDIFIEGELTRSETDGLEYRIETLLIAITKINGQFYQDI